MAHNRHHAQQVRIIGGKWKGRKLRFNGGPGLRPTLGRVRETLFNWLRPHITGMRCLDAFAGSGILGFEALSQGAAEVVFVEQHLRSVQSLQASAALLGVSQCAHINHAHALAYLRRAEQPFDLVFLDPPYDSPALLEKALQLLQEHQLVTTYIYLEAPNSAALERAAAMAELTVMKQTRTGGTAAALLSPQLDIAIGQERG